MNTPDTPIDQEPFRCLIIGVGGCGCAVLNKMIAAEYGGRIQYGESTHYSEVTYLAVDSDSATLDACKAEQKIFIPKAVLDEDEPGLQEQLASIPNADMVFVVSGMGGATGTKISPIIASYAEQREALTIGAATLPLLDEGEPRMASAKRGISNLYQSANSVIVTHMDELLSESTPASTIEDVYVEVGKVIIAGITAIVDASTKCGLVGMDFIDIKTVFENGRISRIGYGTATGEGRARQAVEQALSNPNLNLTDVDEESVAFITITGGSDLSMNEISEISDYITEYCFEYNMQLFLQSFADMIEGDISVTIITSGEDNYYMHKEFAVFYLNEKRKGNKKYRRFFGIPTDNMPVIYRLSVAYEKYPTAQFVNLSIFPKIEQYERNQESKAIVIDFDGVFTVIVVPNLTSILKVKNNCIEQPKKYLKYFNHDSVDGVIRDNDNHLVFLFDVERLLLAARENKE